MSLPQQSEMRKGSMEQWYGMYCPTDCESEGMTTKSSSPHNVKNYGSTPKIRESSSVDGLHTLDADDGINDQQFSLDIKTNEKDQLSLWKVYHNRYAGDLFYSTSALAS